MTDEELFKEAHHILHENMINKDPKKGPGFHYTKPSTSRYPYQFFWDTCFHAFIFSALGEHEMAQDHLLSLFSLQKEDGFVGHMIYWDRLKPGRLTDFFQSRPSITNLYKSHMSALIQPPLAAQAVQCVVKASGDMGFLKQIMPKLKKQYKWLRDNRDFDGDGLLTIISPFESGMDWKPTYDVALNMKPDKADWKLFLKFVSVDFRNFLNNYNLKKIAKKRYFLVKDVGFNTIYAQNLRAMGALCKMLNDPDEQAYRKASDEVTQQILKVMYNKEKAAFFDVFGKDDKQIEVLTPTIFYPVILKGVPAEISSEVMKRHFFNDDEFHAPFAIPSVAQNEASFNPEESLYIWRGPTWIVNNWFLHKFFMERGYEEEAQKLIDSFRKLIEKSGFREYYNPYTGECYGAHGFTWAGLVIDMINMENEHKEKTTVK
ncbi:MAG: trehalase-like protein [Cytophagaceae bacterium]|nr:trehalase-like protein [Cytophagaceae bacterium]